MQVSARAAFRRQPVVEVSTAPGRQGQLGTGELHRNVIRSREGFATLERDWERILAENGDANFYASFAWFHVMLFLAKDTPRDLRIVTFAHNGRIVGICPCHIVQRKARLVKLRSFELIGNVYSPERMLIAQKGYEDAVVAGLLDYVYADSRTAWDKLSFEGLSDYSVISERLEAEMARRALARRRIAQFGNLVTHFGGAGSPKDFLASLSKSMRQTIRSGINRMNREGAFDVLLVARPEHALERAFDDYYSIYAESWKKSESDPQFHRNLGRFMAHRDALRLFILYYKPGAGPAESRPLTVCDDLLEANRTIPDGYLPIAATLFLVHEGCAYYLKTAYREAYAQLSAGSVLFWFAVQQLLTDDRIAQIDHQIGEEPYKLRWNGTLRGQRYLYQADNPSSLRAALERWLERYAAPGWRWIRRLRQRAVAQKVGVQPQ
jgi:CelD/BcsL family acetyltransferase involved in cellulose biosynthesis